MTADQFKALERGDLVRHASGHPVYVVMSNYDDRVMAVRSVDLTNPSEWVLIEPEPAPHQEKQA